MNRLRKKSGKPIHNILKGKKTSNKFNEGNERYIHKNSRKKLKMTSENKKTSHAHGSAESIL